MPKMNNKPELVTAWFIAVGCPDCGYEMEVEECNLVRVSLDECLTHVDCPRCGLQKLVAVSHPVCG